MTAPSSEAVPPSVTWPLLVIRSLPDAPVSSVMTPRERLVTVRENSPKDEVLGLLHKHRIEKVLVIDDDFLLKGMITVKDFQKAT